MLEHRLYPDETCQERIDNECRALVSLRVMKPDDRKSAFNVSQSRWLAYATAAAASGLSFASPAEGEVHYSGILDVKFDNGIQNHRFPLTQGASLDFFRSYSGVYLNGASCGVRHAAVSNAVRDQTYSITFVSTTFRGHFADRLRPRTASLLRFLFWTPGTRCLGSNRGL